MKGLNNGMLWYNFRLLPKINILMCILAICAVQIFFSLKMVDFRVMANIGELFVSLLGIMLIPGLAFIEESSGIKETVYSKAVSPVIPSLIRLLYSVFLLLSGTVIFVAVAVIQGSVFDELSIIAGVFISALILGASGYIVGCFTGNIALAYLIPFAYYGFEFLSKGKYTKDFYLFSLQRGFLVEEKWFLFGTAILFIGISLVYIGKRRSFI
ncbi:hypothetical protein [Pseudobacteroides cellulosolvens]|uniref:ABC-2 type transporter n=1 Tax=Pseudobacteroides cellulosolvens ATCC 35603 = DSM 2933 TaxID=398512 RepID=A0A0L6JTA1_9FIRM|nr:hypothetical protein [Pseudobacteroides cellulosolvens]KNY28910.1 hypothetical protein Bccel_4184 [Pseudobacteroides cellulosolvens ATCC 35603 = DSM 2933]